jgi:S-adenosylmethionine hydrolase
LVGIVGNTIRGIVPVLDVKYGNVGTNIPKSLLDVAVAISQGDFAAKQHIESGVDWEVEVSKAPAAK